MTNPKYSDPISCPVCGKIFAEWVRINGDVTIKKWCKRCKKYVLIVKNFDKGHNI